MRGLSPISLRYLAGYTGHASARRLLRNGLSLEGEEEGPGTFGRSTVGVSLPFVDGGVKKNTQTLYRVVLTGLEAGAHAALPPYLRRPPFRISCQVLLSGRRCEWVPDGGCRSVTG